MIGAAVAAPDVDVGLLLDLAAAFARNVELAGAFAFGLEEDFALNLELIGVFAFALEVAADFGGEGDLTLEARGVRWALDTDKRAPLANASRHRP